MITCTHITSKGLARRWTGTSTQHIQTSNTIIHIAHNGPTTYFNAIMLKAPITPDHALIFLDKLYTSKMFNKLPEADSKSAQLSHAFDNFDLTSEMRCFIRLTAAAFLCHLDLISFGLIQKSLQSSLLRTIDTCSWLGDFSALKDEIENLREVHEDVNGLVERDLQALSECLYAMAPADGKTHPLEEEFSLGKRGIEVDFVQDAASKTLREGYITVGAEPPWVRWKIHHAEYYEGNASPVAMYAAWRGKTVELLKGLGRMDNVCSDSDSSLISDEEEDDDDVDDDEWDEDDENTSHTEGEEEESWSCEE
jgi:hypothetical protein